MLTGLRRQAPSATLLVIDDASPDGTAKIVETYCQGDANARLIVRENERGLGGAIRRGIAEATAGPYDLFVNLDADLSHSPDQVPDLINAAANDPAIDVVVGSRYVAGGQIEGWPLKRRIMSRMVNRFATLFLRLPISDCSGSMRCYRVSTLREIDFTTFRSNGYSFLEELLVRLNRRGAKMHEVPITFSERTEGQSKLTTKEAFRSIGQLIKLSVSPE